MFSVRNLTSQQIFSFYLIIAVISIYKSFSHSKKLTVVESENSTEKTETFDSKTFMRNVGNTINLENHTEFNKTLLAATKNVGNSRKIKNRTEVNEIFLSGTKNIEKSSNIENHTEVYKIVSSVTKQVSETVGSSDWVNTKMYKFQISNSNESVSLDPKWGQEKVYLLLTPNWSE